MAGDPKRDRIVEREGARSARIAAGKLAAGYFIIAGVWILFSDQALAGLALPPAIELVANQTKGMAFVFVTALLLYVFALRHLRELHASEERYHALFENATTGVTIVREARDESGALSALLVEDANMAQATAWGMPKESAIGQRMTADGKPADPVCAQLEFLWQVIEGGTETLERHVEDGDRFEVMAAFHVSGELWAVATTDVTDVRRAQRELRGQEERIRQAYVDVLDAVTGGKLLLLTEPEIESELGEPLMPVGHLDSLDQLAMAREEISAAVERRFPQLARSAAVLNPAGEALNNVLKHAGSGWYRVFALPDAVQVCISDRGPGIDFRNLPKATLVPGFSTTATLGMGFTIMMQLCDRVLLATKPGRTVVVLETKADSKP